MIRFIHHSICHFLYDILVDFTYPFGFILSALDSSEAANLSRFGAKVFHLKSTGIHALEQ